jgi:A/G-specific adenine glycosylase
MIDALSFAWMTYGEIPLDETHLIKMPGVGEYVAGATICFASNVATTLIDTNTVRVIGRLFGLDLSGEPRRRRATRDAIVAVCPSDDPREFYYAIIDLAHQICRPVEPDCAHCPLLTAPCLHGKRFVSRPRGRQSLDRPMP